MKKQKGFTLIELLAVIVILAIIALIATPIVLNIINQTKESATLRSAEFYLNAVENSVAQSMVHSEYKGDGKYNIMKDGNICFELNADKTCKDGFIKVEVKGDKPSGGFVQIEKGKIKEIELQLQGNNIVKENNELVIKQGDKSSDTPADFVNEYVIGEDITFNPGDGDKTWYVIDEDKDTVTLLLSQNLGTGKAWVTQTDYNDNSTYASNYNSKGPITVLQELNSLTQNWNNVDLIDNYSYINNLDGTSNPYGYQKIEIINGVTKLTNKAGNVETTVVGDTKARLMSVDEIAKISSAINTNLTEQNLRNVFTENLNFLIGLYELDSAESVDDAIDQSQINASIHGALMITAYMANTNGISFASNLNMPNIFYQTLDSSSYYWTLTTGGDHSNSWAVYGNGLLMTATTDEVGGIRPVITISKSKI